MLPKAVEYSTPSRTLRASIQLSWIGGARIGGLGGACAAAFADQGEGQGLTLARRSTERHRPGGLLGTDAICADVVARHRQRHRRARRGDDRNGSHLCSATPEAGWCLNDAVGAAPATRVAGLLNRTANKLPSLSSLSHATTAV